MRGELVVLFPRKGERACEVFAKVAGRERWVRSEEGMAEVLGRREMVRCVAFDGARLVRTVAGLAPARRHKLLLLEDLDERDAAVRARMAVLRSLFADVVRPEPALNFLEGEELAEALAAPNAGELAIAASYDPATESIYLLRGNLETLVIPAKALTSSGEGPRPDLGRLRMEDGGQTLAAGRYEASVDALLYEYDAEYRRRLKKKRRTEEQSLGASLRRLRIQKGLRQSDFPGTSMKEIARIERGEVTPRAATMERIAHRLGVRVAEIPDY